jgi:lipopolysaccharide heptosyltransferase II
MHAGTQRTQQSSDGGESPIAVFGFPGLGDLVRCHSFIRLVAAHNPGRPIDVIARRSVIEIAEFMPHVREAIAADLHHLRLNPLARLALAKALRRRGYATAYIVQSSFKSALVPFLARIPERIGWAEECRLPLLTRPRFRMRRHSRMVDRTCWLAIADERDMPARWPEPQLRVPAALAGEFADLAHEVRGMAPVVAISPGSSNPIKNWPVENFAAVARHCIEAGCAVSIVGSTEHRPLAAAIMQSVPARDYLTQSLRRLALTIAAADVFVGNDSGPLHIAAAFGKPSVGIFGSSDATINAPINAVVEIATPELALARKSMAEIGWPSLDAVLCRLDRSIAAAMRGRQAVAPDSAQ